MAKTNYYYDNSFNVYTADEIPFLPNDVKKTLVMAKESDIVFTNEGKPQLLNSTIKEIRFQRDTDSVIEMVNRHHEEEKRKRIDEEQKAEYARQLEKMKQASLEKRNETIVRIYDKLEDFGRVALKVLIVAGVVVAIYAFITGVRATNLVDELHGGRIVDSAGTMIFSEGRPTLGEYHEAFWNLVKDDLQPIINLFGGR